MGDTETLQIRLRNCLQTILDLESDLEEIDLDSSMEKEFRMLKSFIEKMDEMHLVEEDVDRIEKATARFLDEVSGPLSVLDESRTGGRRLQ